MIGKFFKTVFGLIAVILVVLAILRLTPFWDEMLPAGTIESPDFASLTPPATPNWYLVCPSEKCLNISAQSEAPDFDVPAERLRKVVTAMVQSLPNATLVEETPTRLYVVDRTAYVRWPDHVVIEILPVGENASTLIIFSRSQYGRSDFGENKSRVERWLSRLDRLLPAS
ncbi:MAG: DUF1499 domain-containing protein [Proteobacteria bacterium]|nr:DUF1499 domain-containing protein [Pseudomonadota bacterium]